MLQAEVAAELKATFIEKGTLIDDLADNAWGGIYEGSTCFGHQEELYPNDPRDPEMMSRARDYLAATLVETVRHNLGSGLGFAMGAIGAELFGPLIGGYHHQLRKIKSSLDPEEASDAGFYISLDPARTVKEAVERTPEMAVFLRERMRELGLEGEPRRTARGRR